VTDIDKDVLIRHGFPKLMKQHGLVWMQAGLFLLLALDLIIEYAVRYVGGLSKKQLHHIVAYWKRRTSKDQQTVGV
jgi:hypothetical protein